MLRVASARQVRASDPESKQGVAREEQEALGSLGRKAHAPRGVSRGVEHEGAGLTEDQLVAVPEGGVDDGRGARAPSCRSCHW